MRRPAALCAALILAGCSGSAHQAKIAAHDDLSAIQAVSAELRGSGSSAPVTGLTVSGTITNTDGQPLHCGTNTFLIVDESGKAVSPASQFCDQPAIAPSESGYFSATFNTQETDNLQLRFEHPDGSYETHDLIVRPT